MFPSEVISARVGGRQIFTSFIPPLTDRSMCTRLKQILKSFRLPRQQPFVYLMVTISMASCVEYVHPSGQWVEPIDLNLDQQSMKDVVIKLSCVRSQVPGLIEDPNEDSSQLRPCPYLASILEETGAVIYQTANEDSATQNQDKKDEDSEEALAQSNSKRPYDIIVQYKEVRSESSDCALGFIPFYFTISVWPCRSDTQSQASLVVSNPNHGFAQEWPLALETHTYFGFGALALQFVDLFKDPTPIKYQKQMKENFVKFVRNKTYSVYRVTAIKRKS